VALLIRTHNLAPAVDRRLLIALGLNSGPRSVIVPFCHRKPSLLVGVSLYASA
jgi:hypothetical protein